MALALDAAEAAQPAELKNTQTGIPTYARVLRSTAYIGIPKTKPCIPSRTREWLTPTQVMLADTTGTRQVPQVGAVLNFKNPPPPPKNNNKHQFKQTTRS